MYNNIGKVILPIAFTLLGIVTDVRLVHSENTEPSIVVILVGIVTDLSADLENAAPSSEGVWYYSD